LNVVKVTLKTYPCNLQIFESHIPYTGLVAPSQSGMSRARKNSGAVRSSTSVCHMLLRHPIHITDRLECFQGAFWL